MEALSYGNLLGFMRLALDRRTKAGYEPKNKEGLLVKFQAQV